MENTPEFLKNNDHYLKSFILGEVIQKNPIFNFYRKLCKLVGHDVMEYSDFEFWFFRFYHENRDFNYHRSADPKPKTLMDLPIELMYKIAGNLDQFERRSLRSMNHAIKEVADSIPPIFEKIFISVSNTKLEWELNKKEFECNSDSLDKSRKTYLKKGLEQLTLIFKMPNLQVKQLGMMVWDPIPELDNLLPALCHVKIAHICCYSISMILQLLLSIKPRHLESLIIGGCWDPIDIADCKLIFETEQFKNAKYVAFLWQVKFNVEDLVNFRQLRQFQCWMKNDIGPEEILRVRDIVSSFEHFESCDLILRSTEDIFPMGRFAEALGAEIPIGPLAEGEDWTFNHHYKIPKSNECLEFKLTVKESWCRVNIVRIR